MDFEKFLNDTKKKYQPEQMEVKLTPCSVCKHPETKYCLMCEDCGRKFENKRLVYEYDGTPVDDCASCKLG